MEALRKLVLCYVLCNEARSDRVECLFNVFFDHMINNSIVLDIVNRIVVKNKKLFLIACGYSIYMYCTMASMPHSEV